MTSLKLPIIGLGTWKLKPAAAKYSTIEALKLGYRFIDTAQAYRNEKGVGQGLQEIFNSGILKRKDLIVATKLHPLSLRPRSVFKSTTKSLKKLKLDYVDILYVHYPAFVLGYSHKKTLNAISQLIDEGKVLHLGVSNFTTNMVDEALEVCDKPIYVNQIELHPYLKQKQLLEHHKKKGVHVVSYSPLARGYALDDSVIEKIAKKNNMSAAQVCLVWVISKGAIPIPKATSLEHLHDNFVAKSKQIPSEDLEIIDKITKYKRMVHPPVVAPKEWKK
ncbi:MAG: aldo/keto reductase [Candidatus Thorarchaeota archaeon]